MSKVICDVCGTAYAENVTQCPICGCVRSADAEVVSGTVEEVNRGNGSYTYVKGGRFSKANVKKRNKANHIDVTEPETETRQEKRARLRNEQRDKSNKGLVITVIALLLAIVAVVAYIVIRFFAPFSAVQNAEQPNSTPDVVLPVEIPCTQITLGNEVITLESVGAAALLDATLTPADTTDKITYSSADESIATVDENGKVTAIAAGETVIRVTCGTASAECKVVCSVEIVDEPTEPEVTEPMPTEPSVPEVEYTFNTVFPNEMTLKAGSTFGLRLQDPNKKSVNATFSSGNASVCTVDADGTVHAVAKGSTNVRAEFNGKTYNCKVIGN